MIVVVSGSPGSGKTTLARQLAPRLRLPLISKDDIKETLFDSLAWPSGVEASQKLGGGVWDVLFMLLDRAVEADASIVIESNFHTEHRERFAQLDTNIVEVYCFASPETLERRMRERERHPAHADANRTIDGRESLRLHQPVTEGAIRVDTEDPDQIDVDEIITKIREAQR